MMGPGDDPVPDTERDPCPPWEMFADEGLDDPIPYRVIEPAPLTNRAPGGWAMVPVCVICEARERR